MKLQSIKNKFGHFSIFVIVLLILGLSLRGLAGNPDSEALNTHKWKETGPLELSPEKGRYALTYSLIEDKSVFFSLPVARFVTPDLGYWNGKYVSLFAPGVSILVIPGYILGKAIGLAQVGTFGVVALFAAANFVLIEQIARKFGASNFSAKLAGLVFLFATPAFAYAVTLYQHHISTFILLLSVFLLLKYPKRLYSLFIVWFLCAFSIMIDNPNLFMMFPVGMVGLIQLIDFSKKTEDVTVFSIVPLRLLSLLGIIIPLVVFGYFNFITYESPFRLAGTVPYVANLDEEGKPYLYLDDDGIKVTEDLSAEAEQNAVAFFQTRNINNGLFIHLFSPDRGVLVYTPVLLLGFIGIYLVYKSRNPALQVLLSIIVLNLILYSMWGDPWGGWAFGSRYLIPSYAIMSIFIAVALSKFAKSRVFNLIFVILLIYSVAVNTAGALTSNKLPPKIQILELEALSGREELYSYDRSFEFLMKSGSKSFVYQEYVSRYLKATEYYAIIVSLIIFTSFTLIIFNQRSGKELK